MIEKIKQIMKKSWKLIKKHLTISDFIYLLIIIFCIIFLRQCQNAEAADRCAEYIPDIRSAHVRYLGSGFPYHYGIGVMIAESACRPNIVSFDGGIGLYQFTPSTGVVTEMKKEIPNFNPSNPQHSIRAFAYYHKKLINNMETKRILFKSKYYISPKDFKDQCGLRLCYIHTIYNGGLWLVREWEASSRRSCEFVVLRTYCTRGGATVSGRYLSFCDINYSYALKVWNYSKPYKVMSDGNYKFW